jgi:hypothetical protein
LYLEVKALFSSVAMIFIAIVLVRIMMVDLFLTFLLLVAIILVLMGDMFIGYKIVTSDVKPIMEPTPKGKELMELQQIDGRVRFMNTTKGAYGKRSFRINGEDASVINDGKAPFRLPSGNHGFRAHELFDMNVDPKRAKALQQMKGDNIKEVYFQEKNKIDGGNYNG